MTRTKNICFIPLSVYFPVRKMLPFLKPQMFPPKMSPKVKGAVALLSPFQRLSLFANAYDSFPSLQIFSVWSFISGVTCTWRMPQKLSPNNSSCSFLFLECDDIREKLQPKKVLKSRILNHFWLHIFLLSLQNYYGKKIAVFHAFRVDQNYNSKS